MRGTDRLASLRAVLSSLAVFASIGLGSAGVADASAKKAAPLTSFAYETTGHVDIEANPSSVSGPSALTFQGSSGTYVPNSGQTIPLGQFVVPSGAAGQASTTYSNTPFDVEIKAPEFDKTTKVPLLAGAFSQFGRALHLKTETVNSLLLRGHLDGTVSATGRSNLTATVDSVRLGGLDATTKDQVIHYTFPIRYSQLKLPTTWTMTGVAPTAAELLTPSPAAEMLAATPTPTPAPEPSTFAVFAVALGALALARRRAR